MKIIGITGGTGAGKTTALNVLRGMGAYIIDCDQVYHQLLETSAELVAAIGARFPGAVEDGKLDRKKLGTVVFSSPQDLIDLNSITEPFVLDRVSQLIHYREGEGWKISAIDAIGLLESGISDLCSCKIAVTAPEEMRLRRIMEREGISREYAERRIKAQKPPEYYAKNCDYVLVNDFATQEQFEAYCRDFFERLFS